MITNAKYAHTNLVARDWRALAQFYQDVFGCVPVPPGRGYSGPDLERGTGIHGAALKGAHLRLPGYGPDGPTLEIFQYSEFAEEGERAVNRPGFGHIAFGVDDVHEAREQVLSYGCEAVGDVVTLSPAPGKEVTWCYVRDPEGNIIELQSWASRH